MLNEEEISKLKINVFNQCDDETIRLVAEMLKHKDQLELDKQKLIEKLEKDKKSNNKSMTDVLNYTNMVKATRVLYAQEILNFISE